MLYPYPDASSAGKLFKPSFWTKLYGKFSISAVNAWNNTVTAFGDVFLKK